MKKKYYKPVLLIEEMVSDTNISSGYMCQLRGGGLSETVPIPFYASYLPDIECWDLGFIDMMDGDGHCYDLLVSSYESMEIPEGAVIEWNCGCADAPLGTVSTLCKEN